MLHHEQHFFAMGTNALPFAACPTGSSVATQSSIFQAAHVATSLEFVLRLQLGARRSGLLRAHPSQTASATVRSYHAAFPTALCRCKPSWSSRFARRSPSSSAPSTVRWAYMQQLAAGGPCSFAGSAVLLGSHMHMHLHLAADLPHHKHRKGPCEHHH